jgi:hypothetical protein
MFGDACDILAASGGSRGVVAAMRRASHRAEASLRTPFAADLFEDIRDPGLVRDKALFGSYLTFPRLEQLEPEAAEELTEYPEDLSLPALRTLSPASARRLRAAVRLRLDGLETLPAETVTALCAGDPPARAVFLELSLNGLRDLGPAAARALTSREGRGFQGTLDLSGLRTLPPDVARGLRRHAGQLLLEELRIIPLSDGNGSPSVAIPERFRSP